MRLLLVALVLSGCAPTIKCVAQEGYGELPRANMVQIAPLIIEDVDDAQRAACQQAFREAALEHMRGWSRVEVVDAGGDLTLAATLNKSEATLRVLQKNTVVREVKFTTHTETFLDSCRAFGAEIIEARRGCPVFL